MNKSFILSLTGNLFIAVLIISCTNEHIETFEQTSLNICIEKYDEIGIIHNEGLDYIFGEIKDYLGESLAADISKTDILMLSESANKTFLNTYNLCDESRAYTYSHIERVFSNQYMPERMSFVDLSVDKMDIQFSESLVRLFEMLHSLMLADNIYLQAKILDIEKIETQALDKLSADDLDMFLSATSVAKHTLAYWDSNLLNWIYLLNGEEVFSLEKSDFSWESLAVEDVAGAIGGAAGAKVAAFFGPVGWKAMAGIIGGAATANSVKYAVVTIMSEESKEQDESE